MSKPISFSPSNTGKYVKAMLDAGLDVDFAEVTPDGVLRVYAKRSEKREMGSDEQEFEEFRRASNGG